MATDTDDEAGHPKIEIVLLWITDDLSPSRDERWVNALVKKRSD